MHTRVRISLHLIALLALGILSLSRIKNATSASLSLMVAVTAIGFLIGSWTCHIHQKNKGLWITILIFTILNFLHSLVDGISLAELGVGTSKDIAIFSHEIARQPALYLTLFGMLTPFGTKAMRFIIVPLVVTGSWVIATYLGYVWVSHAQSITWLEPIAEYALFLFFGDILHHLVEDIRKNRHTCCHE